MRAGGSLEGIARKRTQGDASKAEMVFPSPLSKWNKSGKDEASASDRELLQELVTLNYTLDRQETKRSRSLQHPIYSGKQMHATTAPSPEKYTLLSGRRFHSIHEARDVINDDTPVVHNEDKRFLPPLYRRPLSMDISGEFTEEPIVTTFHHSISDSPHGSDRQFDIRPRRGLVFSSEALKLQHGNQSYMPEKSPGSSHRFDASSTSDTKKSVWSWKPLRALSHFGRQRFYCVFSLHVHEIEGLPLNMNGLRLCVHMRKMETKEGAVQTMPSRVFRGIAEFEETLDMKCTLYSNRGYSNVTKFLPKDIIISVVSPDMDGINFGKHQISLSKLLSFLMDSLTGQVQEGRSWDMELDLTGKAKGAKLVVTFRCQVLDKDPGSFAHSSSRFIFSSSHRSSSQLSYNFSSSAHSTPGPVSMGYPFSFIEPGDKSKMYSEMDSFNLDEVIPSIEAGAARVTDAQKGPPFSKTRIRHVHETEVEELSEEEIEFIVIDRGIETSGPVQRFLTEEYMMTREESNINEMTRKNADENKELDVDWHVVEILEGEGADKIQQEKEGELLLSWESMIENEDKAIQRPAFCEKKLRNVSVEIEGALETENHEDENEKIIAVDEGGKRVIFQTNEDLPILEESNVKEQQSQNIGNTELEFVTVDIKEIVDKAFDMTSSILSLEMDANIQNLECADTEDIDGEIDLVAGEFLRLLESEQLS